LAVEVAQANNDMFNKVQTNQSAYKLRSKADCALLHELQLVDQLNHSVQDTRRADFSLLLAMLAEDVREQSQFLLPQEKSAPTKEQTNSVLRKKFNLPEKLPLALARGEDVIKFNQAQHLTDNHLIELRLSDVLQPKPLTFRDDKQFISSQIVDNTSLLTQLKLQQLSFNKQQIQKNTEQLTDVKSTNTSLDHDNIYNQTLNTRQAINVNAWLNVVQESIVKTSPVS
jgi:hypothetical protein